MGRQNFMMNLPGNSSAFQMSLQFRDSAAHFLAEYFELAKATPHGMRHLVPSQDSAGIASVLTADAKAPSLKIAPLRPTVVWVTAARASILCLLRSRSWLFCV